LCKSTFHGGSGLPLPVVARGTRSVPVAAAVWRNTGESAFRVSLPELDGLASSVTIHLPYRMPGILAIASGFIVGRAYRA
jgi:hypothetical protein